MDGKDPEAAATKARYNRIAPFYDIMESLVERRFSPWRKSLLSCAGGRILEVGVGTGKNLPHYPSGSRVVGLDLADKMLIRARRRASKAGLSIELVEGDVERLNFPDSAFDTAVATFVFCSVAHPVAGLRELRRVVKPDGRILLLEHVRIDRPVIGPIMDLINPLTVRLSGANINRRTLENVRMSGMAIDCVKDLGPLGIVKWIAAKPNKDR